ncbi:helix-turn-helix domain-containing protein [Streptomyces sp. NPDC091272]|uniref:helix-turn-helix domain-containing protein n=1 Tax=Streptomyces sp. NPDC091272 TaxID=3365981 RepID=UPI0038018E67
MRNRSGTAAPPGADTAAGWAGALSQWLTPVAPGPHHREPVDGVVTAHHFGYVRMLTCVSGPLPSGPLPSGPSSGPLPSGPSSGPIPSVPSSGPLPSRPSSGSLHLVRDTGRAVQAPDAIALVLLLGDRGGTAELGQEGRTSLLRGGQFALVDLREDFALRAEGAVDCVLFRLPLHALHVPPPALRSATARALPASGSSGPLMPLLTHLARAASDRSAATASRVVRERLGGIVTDQVAALVEDLAQDAGPVAVAGPGQLVAAVRAYVDGNLGDLDLTAERIARAHRISVRYLHRLFESEDLTVGRLIQLRRVERCAEELARRERVGPSIAVVAARWGFRSAAHFSRSFKAVHGHPPQQWRRLVSGG